MCDQVESHCFIVIRGFSKNSKKYFKKSFFSKIIKFPTPTVFQGCQLAMPTANRPTLTPEEADDT
jgi:hypothetical protein